MWLGCVLLMQLDIAILISENSQSQEGCHNEGKDGEGRVLKGQGHTILRTPTTTT